MRLFRTFLLGMTWYLSGHQAYAASIVDVIVSRVDDSNVFNYAITNQGALGIFSFGLVVTGDITAVSAPTGWVAGMGHPSSGTTLVQWVDIDAPFDVPSLSRLDGFVVASSSNPGSSLYSTLDENLSLDKGTVLGPQAATPVPEPGFTGVFGAVVLCFLSRYKSGLWRGRY